MREIFLASHLEPSSRPSSSFVPLAENLPWARTVGGLGVPLGELRSPSAGVQAEVFAGERSEADSHFIGGPSLSCRGEQVQRVRNVFGGSRGRGERPPR